MAILLELVYVQVYGAEYRKIIKVNVEGDSWVWSGVEYEVFQI